MEKWQVTFDTVSKDNTKPTTTTKYFQHLEIALLFIETIENDSEILNINLSEVN